MEFAGDAMPIVEQADSISASPNGILAYGSRGFQGTTQLTWVDRKGTVISTAGEAGEYTEPALSSDDGRVAYSVMGICGCSTLRAA
jgi:hypothetical protein